MATQIKISELPLANESALSLAADDRIIFNNDNVNTQTIKFANFVDAILEQNLTFKGNCQFTQPITGPNGGDIQVGLDDLVDVQFANVTSGQVIQFSGTQWINKDVSDIAVQLDDLSVTTGAASGGGALSYDQTTGVFTFNPADTGSFTAATLSAVNDPVASGGGVLSYNPTTAVFNFKPADCYTKAQSYDSNQIDAALALKADVATTYTKNETDSALGAKATYDLVGVSNGEQNLGTFQGSLIPPNQNVKVALQVLETASEANTSAIAGVPTDVYTKTETDGLLADKISVDGGLTVTTSAASGGGSLAYDDAGGIIFAPADLSDFATSANAALTGVPTAPTAGAGTNTTQVATTAFVTGAVADNNAAYISITDLKTLVAAAGDYSAFQTAIAAL